MQVKVRKDPVFGYLTGEQFVAGGTVSGIRSRKDDWAAFMLKGEKQYYSCSGVAPGLTVGRAVKCKLEPKRHPVYGLQYKVLGIVNDSLSTGEGMVKFLSSKSFRGIGPAKAKKIVDHFGDGTEEIISTDPERLKEVVTAKDMEAIKEGWKGDEAVQLRQLYQVTNGYATSNEIQKIQKQYGKDAVHVLKTDPYRITFDIDGIGFAKADRIAKGTGIDQFNKTRIKAAIKHVMENIANMKGDCYSSYRDLRESTLDLLNPLEPRLMKKWGLRAELTKENAPWEQKLKFMEQRFGLDGTDLDILRLWHDNALRYASEIPQRRDEMVEEKWLILQDSILAASPDDEMYMVRSIYKSEEGTAEFIKWKLDETPLPMNASLDGVIKDCEKRMSVEFDSEQVNAIRTALSSRLSVITGGPGRGKTAIITAIVAYWKAVRPNAPIYLVAPTGRAAKRIDETLGPWIDRRNITTGTIHRVSGYGSRSKIYPLRNDALLICDESSMVDINLAAGLMAFAGGATTVLVGDANQLPPVGPGNFFKDVIKCGEVPVAYLVKCYRNSGLIASNSDRILAGNTHLETGGNFHMELLPKENIADRVVSFYMESVKTLEPSDMCCITLQRTRGGLSVDSLNARIQDLYNPLKGKKTVSSFRVRDRVMHIKNDYELQWKIFRKSGTPLFGSGLFNGDTGTVQYVAETDEGPKVSVLFDDGKVAEYTTENISELTLAYAVTAHKSQGSQYKRVIISLSMEQYMLLDRTILYTAETRAEQDVYIFAEEKALKRAIRNEESRNRNTLLAERITGEI